MKGHVVRWLVLSCLLGALLAFPVAVEAAPQVLPVSSSVVDVDGAVDFFSFPQTGVGGQYVLTGPSGLQLVLEQTAATAQGETQSFTLDGTQVQGNATFAVTGDLSGTPADGTWTIQGVSIQGSATTLTLSVATKSISIQGNVIVLALGNRVATTVFWNWRTSPTGQYGFVCAGTPAFGYCSIQPPETDPNNAVFFQDAAESPLTAYTLHANVTCSAVPTMTVNGAWLGGTATLFSRFAYRDGNFLGQTDLRATFGTLETTAENEGNTASGTDNKTVAYNNAAGTSYQFIVNTTTQGEALGFVAFAPPGQCTPAAPGGSILYAKSIGLDLSVSQAQCANDYVSFTTDVDVTALLTVADLQVTIFNAINGTELATFDEAEMFTQNAGQVFYFATVLPPGAYMAIAQADIAGVGAVDFYDSEAVNVPRGTCEDTPTDLTPILIALGHLDINVTTNLTAVLSAIANITPVYNFTGNNTFNIDNATQQAILQNVTDHRNNTIEVNMTSNFNGLGFDGLIFLFFWIAVMLFAVYQEWWFVLGFSIPGLFDTMFPDQIPGTFYEWFVFCLLGFCLEVAANQFSWGAYRNHRKRDA